MRISKPITVKRLMEMDCNRKMTFDELVEIIGNKMCFKQYDQLEGDNAKEKIENLFKKWNREKE